MRKVTDNELDKIFREAADRNEPEFDPKDWEDMAKRLDQDDKAALSRSKTLYTMVALLIISTLWPQFKGKDKTQTASVLESPAPMEWKEQTLKEEAPASERDQSVTGAASASEGDQVVNEETSASKKNLSVTKGQPVKDEASASGKGRAIQEEDAVARKGQSVTTEGSAVEKDQAGKERNSATDGTRPVASAKKSAGAKKALAVTALAEDDSSTGNEGEALGPDKVGLSREGSTNERSMKAGVIISEKTNKNILSKSPVDQEQHQAVRAGGKESAGLPTAGLASEKDGATQTSRSAQGIGNDNEAAHDKGASDKTLNKEQSIMGEAAAAGDDRLPSSANGEIILMNDGQSQSPVQPQSPPIIILEGIATTKKDGSPGIAVSSESKVNGDERTSVTPNLTAHPADPAGPAAKDSTQQAEKNIAPVQTDADSGTVQKDWKNEKQAFSHSWFVKLPVSPDFSSINYTTPGKPGINIGLLGEYSLSRHFSVSTGAIYSKKLYGTKDPGKSYSSGGWTAKASSLDGDCRVLDIPINVTYYIFPESKTNLFVTLGSSSYIMLKEKYVYTVWANHQDYQYEENFSHKNNEWFSMLNISIGVQRRIGEHFFVQAEPFLKAPMSGVGEGKVNLVSTGVFFSLKYKLGK